MILLKKVKWRISQWIIFTKFSFHCNFFDLNQLWNLKNTEEDRGPIPKVLGTQSSETMDVILGKYWRKCLWNWGYYIYCHWIQFFLKRLSLTKSAQSELSHCETLSFCDMFWLFLRSRWSLVPKMRWIVSSSSEREMIG